MKILIVDDNHTNIIIVREILKKEKFYNIAVASSASEMFKVLGLNQPPKRRESTGEIDLILLDMMMPEMDGIEACRVLQQHPQLKEIPVIMVTAVGDSKKLAEALDAGAVDFVTKPINKVELMARIRSALRLKKEKDWHKERDQHLRDELKLAAKVQSAVLSPPIHDEHFKIDAFYNPSDELAGDLYSWYPLGDGRYGVILLDIMGHGISSSLFCMFIASVLKDTLTTYVEPEKVIHELNRRFNSLHIEDQLIQYYFTAIYLVVDTKFKKIDYVNAGHPPGLLFMQNGDVIRLDTVCSPVGLFDTIDATTTSVSYEGSGHIVLYTDGLMELLADEQDQQIEALTLLAKNDHHLNTVEMKTLLSQLEPRSSREDDQCLVWISFDEGE